MDFSYNRSTTDSFVPIDEVTAMSEKRVTPIVNAKSNISEHKDNHKTTSNAKSNKYSGSLDSFIPDSIRKSVKDKSKLVDIYEPKDKCCKPCLGESLIITKMKTPDRKTPVKSEASESVPVQKESKIKYEPLVIDSSKKKQKKSSEVISIVNTIPVTKKACFEIKQDLIHHFKEIFEYACSENALKSRWNGTLPKDLNCLPPQTLIIQWKSTFHIPLLTPEMIYAIYSRLGNIVAMGQLAVNKILIVYDDLATAIKVKSFDFETWPNFCMISSWYHLEMNSSKVRGLLLSEIKKYKDVTGMTLEERQRRNLRKLIVYLNHIVVKFKAIASYNLDSFVP